MTSGIMNIARWLLRPSVEWRRCPGPVGVILQIATFGYRLSLAFKYPSNAGHYLMQREGITLLTLKGPVTR